MLSAFIGRARDERGHTELSLLGTIVVTAVLALTATLWFATAGQAAKPLTAAQSARALLRRVETTAHALAGEHGGSYVTVGKLNLHKHGLIPFNPSRKAPWVSDASGSAHSYTVTVTAEPTGQTFTLTRSAGGAITIR
jgi:hypothetical protein